MPRRDVAGTGFELSSDSEVTSTSSRAPPNRERICQMVALTRDFHVFASRVTADFSAVFLSICYVTETWYVRALVHPLIRHFDSFPSRSSPMLHRRDSLDVAPRSTDPSKFDDTPSVHSGFRCPRSSRQIAFSSPNSTSLIARDFPRLWPQRWNSSKVSSVDRRIARRY
jgi:hypothetical protein